MSVTPGGVDPSSYPSTKVVYSSSLPEEKYYSSKAEQRLYLFGQYFLQHAFLFNFNVEGIKERKKDETLYKAASSCEDKKEKTAELLPRSCSLTDLFQNSSNSLNVPIMHSYSLKRLTWQLDN
jgi:hypothetical protein